MADKGIDVSKNWEDSVRDLLEYLPYLNPEGVKDAHRQIIHAAKIADLHVKMIEAGLGSSVNYNEVSGAMETAKRKTSEFKGGE
tara:strand:- start:3 stop:254 length:252 start_codon:yes stop_codon:yes gene_type:complete